MFYKDAFYKRLEHTCLKNIKLKQMNDFDSDFKDV